MAESLIVTQDAETAEDGPSHVSLSHLGPHTRRVLLVQIRDQDEALEHEVQCVQETTGLDAAQLPSLNVVRSAPRRWSELKGIDALIIGGSGDHSATEDYDFTPWLETLVREAVAAGTPLFGICWGHHFIARAFGGTVVTDPLREEVGTFDVRLTEAGRNDPLFHATSPRFAANLVHHDCVAEPPPGFVELAVSDRCRYQALRCPERPLVCTQFHGEMDKPALSYRLGLYRDEYIDDIDQARRIIDGLRATPEAGNPLRHFLELYT